MVNRTNDKLLQNAEMVNAHSGRRRREAFFQEYVHYLTPFRRRQLPALLQD
jgi:hypothetical protein